MQLLIKHINEIKGRFGNEFARIKEGYQKELFPEKPKKEEKPIQIDMNKVAKLLDQKYNFREIAKKLRIPYPKFIRNYPLNMRRFNKERSNRNESDERPFIVVF